MALNLALSSATVAQSPLTFSKAFSPSTIGPGGVSTLTFTITNNTAQPASEVTFEDNLPAGVVGHEGSTIVVILNGLRLLRGKKGLELRGI